MRPCTAGTPSPHINKGIALVVMKIHDLIGADVNDPRTTSAGRFKVITPSTDENLAGNPLHAYLVLGVLGFLIVRRQTMTTWLLNYSGAVVTTFFVFSFLFKWQIFGSRYNLPFFASCRLRVRPVSKSVGSINWVDPVGSNLALGGRDQL